MNIIVNNKCKESSMDEIDIDAMTEKLYKDRVERLQGKRNAIDTAYSILWDVEHARNAVEKQRWITLLEENFPSFIKHTNLFVLKDVLESKDTQKIALDNIDVMVEKFATEVANTDVLKKDNIASQIRQVPILSKVFEQNIDKVIAITKPKDLFNVTKRLKGYSEETDTALNSALEANKTEVAKSLLQPHVEQYGKEAGEAFLHDYADSFATLFDDLLKDANSRWVDIQFLAKGATSEVYMVGNNVVKLGNKRFEEEIENSNMLLQPLYRRAIQKGKAKVFLEVAPLVDMLPSNMKLDEANGEKLIKELKDEFKKQGLVCTDIELRNIGILKRANEPTLHGKKVKVSPEATGMKHTSLNGEVKQKGDYVIIDLDSVYKRNEDDKER